MSRLPCQQPSKGALPHETTGRTAQRTLRGNVHKASLKRSRKRIQAGISRWMPFFTLPGSYFTTPLFCRTVSSAASCFSFALSKSSKSPRAANDTAEASTPASGCSCRPRMVAGISPFQLAPGTLRPEAGRPVPAYRTAQLVIFIGAKRRRVPFHIGGDPFFRLPEAQLQTGHSQNIPKGIHRKYAVIAGKIFVMLHQVVIQGPVAHNLSFCRGVDGIIDQNVGVLDGIGHPQGIGAEGQVIVPGQDAENSVLLIQKIIMPGAVPDSCPSSSQKPVR